MRVCVGTSRRGSGELARGAICPPFSAPVGLRSAVVPARGHRRCLEVGDTAPEPEPFLAGKEDKMAASSCHWGGAGLRDTSNPRRGGRSRTRANKPQKDARSLGFQRPPQGDSKCRVSSRKGHRAGPVPTRGPRLGTAVASLPRPSLRLSAPKVGGLQPHPRGQSKAFPSFLLLGTNVREEVPGPPSLASRPGGPAAEPAPALRAAGLLGRHELTCGLRTN